MQAEVLSLESKDVEDAGLYPVSFANPDHPECQILVPAVREHSSSGNTHCNLSPPDDSGSGFLSIRSICVSVSCKGFLTPAFSISSNDEL